MNSDSLAIEYDYVLKSVQKGFQITNNLLNFFKGVRKNKEAYHSNIKKSLSDAILVFQRETLGNRDSLSQNLILYFEVSECLNAKQSCLLSKLEKEIIDPMELFHQHSLTANKENLENFKNVNKSN